MDAEKTPEFYKAFYEENRVKLLQYDSLRVHFMKMIDDIMGKGYYNAGMDIYTCDQLSCEDITRVATSKTLVGSIKEWVKNFVTSL